MGKRRRRRNWSDDEKRMICAQARMPGVSVSQVARRYDVNANQVFNWMKDERFEVAPDDVAPPCFLPVEVTQPDMSEHPATTARSLEVEIDGGVRLKICGEYDPEALAALLRKLSS